MSVHLGFRTIKFEAQFATRHPDPAIMPRQPTNHCLGTINDTVDDTIDAIHRKNYVLLLLYCCRDAHYKLGEVSLCSLWKPVAYLLTSIA